MNAADGLRIGQASSDSGVAAPASAIVEQATHDTPKRSFNAKCRGVRTLGWVTPWLLTIFILAGWHYCNFNLAPFLWRTRSIYAVCFTAAFNILVSTTFVLFLAIVFAPANHSSCPREPPLSILRREVAYECIDDGGSIARCWQDECNGAWSPPRSRHCKDCRRHRELFDHCCPWFGTCISRDTMKLFIFFLAAVPPTIVLGLAEVGPIAVHQFKLVKAQQWDDPHIASVWWSRWYSWIGGPFYRYMGAAVIAYWRYERRGEQPSVSLGPMVFLIVGSMLAIMTIVLNAYTIRAILGGQTWIEGHRTRFLSDQSAVNLIWQPNPGLPVDQVGRCGGEAVVLRTKAGLYYDDHSRMASRIFGETWRQRLNPFWQMTESTYCIVADLASSKTQ